MPSFRAVSLRLGTHSGPVLGLVIVLGLFLVLFSARGDVGQFVSPRNIRVLVYSDTVIGVAALAMLLVIISGGIDLSTGSVVALVTVVTMQAYRLIYEGPEPVLPEWLVKVIQNGLHKLGLEWQGTQSVAWSSLTAVTVGTAVGGLCGLCNGLVITRLRVVPFVATLGMLSIARGLAVWLSGGQTINFTRESRPGWVEAFADVHSEYTYFSPSSWTLGVLAMLVVVLLRRTVLGRYCYAIGSNEQAARLSGVPVERSKVLIYTLAGLLTGWAGVLEFIQLGSGQHSSAVGLELSVIAAVVIGGASLSGGQGTVTGTMIGVLILAILKNGVNNFNVPVEVQYILIGVIIIVNTALSGWQRR